RAAAVRDVAVSGSRARRAGAVDLRLRLGAAQRNDFRARIRRRRRRRILCVRSDSGEQEPHMTRSVLIAALVAACATLPAAEPAPPPKYPALPSETPARFRPITDSFNYVKRDVMIPMRDGVRLHTVVIVPKGASRAPMLLTRTPYDANALTSHADSGNLGSIL